MRARTTPTRPKRSSLLNKNIAIYEKYKNILSGDCRHRRGLFTACSDDDFKAGPEVDGAQVYFPENVTTQHSISDDVSSIAIPVKRIAKDEALTVAVLASDESGLFTIPSSVSFAAGKETSELLITFDRTKLEDGKEYPFRS